MNTILGITFLLSGAAATFLMYHLWGYPYDKVKHESSAPQSLVFVHRFLGYIYIGIYVYLMIQMVPRMWLYQIELPARTVVHLTCGILIGAILIIKLMIVRFFRHLEGTLIPALGTALLLLTVIVISLSVPFAIRESMLNNQAVAGGVGLQENLDRVTRHLADIGLDDEVLKAQLSTSRGLILGRKVLNNQCVLCHDLRTVLIRPKTAKQWHQTVESMAGRSDIFSPISKEEQWQVTAYLIAISPDLQRSAEQQSSIAKAKIDSAAALKVAIGQTAPPATATSPVTSSNSGNANQTVPSSVPENASKTGQVETGNQTAANNTPDPNAASSQVGANQTAPATPPATDATSTPATIQPPAGYSAEQAKALFEIKCIDCHNVTKIENKPPGNLDDVRSLVEKMVGKGMEGTAEEFETLIYYISQTYVK